MGSPSASLATLRPDLAGSFQEFELAAERQGFIGQRIMPVMEVAKAFGLFGKLSIEQLLQNRDTVRAPGSGYSRGKFEFGKDTFACIENGAEEPIDDNEATLYREFYDAEQVAAARAFDAVLRNMEKRIAAAVFNATTWTSNTTAITEEWDTAAAAVPRADVKAAMQAVWDASGLWPNALICNRKVFNNIGDTAEVIDRLKYSGHHDPRPGMVTEQAIAQALGIDQVIVAGSAKQGATEGQASSISPIWSDEYAMVAKVAMGNDIREPCMGRIFHWGEDGSSIGGTVESYREEALRGNIVRVRHQVDEKILFVEAAHLLSNATTI